MTYTREEFTRKYSPFISKLVKGTGILVGTVIAQAILESSGNYYTDGKWRVGGSKLSQKANNYFGIKCHNWKGKVYNIDTGEYTKSGEKYISRGSCFRAYDNVEDSIRDYVKFLKSNPRYAKAGVFQADTVAQQATALKAAGYATAPNYAGTVNSVYEGVKDFIIETTKFQLKFFKKYWWAVLLGTAGVVGIVYVTVKSKSK